MAEPEESLEANAKTTAEQIKNILGLSGVKHARRWQELQRLANEVCKEFFPPELQWKELSSEQVDKARDAMEDRDPLLEGRPDLAHWFISKYQRSASYIYRQRLGRSSALEPFIPNQSTSVQSSADIEGQGTKHTDGKKTFDAVRNEWV